MPQLAPQSIDAIITDLPYGVTSGHWDSVIPLEDMWSQVDRVLKTNGAFITTATNPFASILIASKVKWYRHEWVWVKTHHSNFAHAKRQPLRKHELVLVFGREPVKYYPQMVKGKPLMKNIGKKVNRMRVPDIRSTGISQDLEAVLSDTYYPISPLYFNCVGRRSGGLHPTQKPVELYEYLVKTYTNPGDVVLDLAMGSGTTGEACINLNRKFIGIEKDEEYFARAQGRIENAFA